MSHDADVVVIGSGVAGALLARKLAEAGVKVTILEAGGAINRTESTDRYQRAWNRTLNAPYETWPWAPVPGDNNKADYYSPSGNHAYQALFMKGVGGTTWHWTAITPRFLPADFRMYSEYGVGVDWPIDYSDLEPWYGKAETALGVAGDSSNDHGSPRSSDFPIPPIPMPWSDQVIAGRLKKRGIRVSPFPAARNSRDYDGRPQCCGNNSCTPLCPIGAGYSADHDVAKAVRAGARLIDRAVVQNFERDEAGRITAVDYLRPDHSSKRITGRFFVVSCNSIETPRLLLNAGNEKFPNGVANSSGQVGRNLMDHLIFTTSFRMPEPLYIGRGPQSVSTIEKGRDGVFRKKHAAAKFFIGNDLNIHLEAARLLENQKNWSAPLEKLREAAIHQGYFGAEVEQLPDENNRLTIDPDHRDQLGLPLPRIQYTPGSYAEAGLKVWQAYTDSLIGMIGAEKTDSNYSLSSHHPSGTTRMGRDAKSSVVDRNCRSHDHPNLYIAGAGVFPTMGTANPTLTIAALSLRLADHLKTILSHS